MAARKIHVKRCIQNTPTPSSYSGMLLFKMHRRWDGSLKLLEKGICAQERRLMRINRTIWKCFISPLTLRCDLIPSHCVLPR